MYEFSFKCPKCGVESCLFEEFAGTVHSAPVTSNYTLVVCALCRFAETYSIERDEFLRLHNLMDTKWNPEDAKWVEPELPPGSERESM